MANLPRPFGAQQVLSMKAQGLRVPDPVIVSWLGEATDFDCLHVFPNEGVRYDWSFLEDCAVHLVVAPGIDAEEQIADVMKHCRHNPYPGVTDTGLQRLAYVIDPKTMRLWHSRRGCAEWLEWFQ